MRIIFTLFFLGASLVSSAQNDMLLTEVEANFPGGPDALQRYIANTVVYPEKAIDRNWEGKVYVTFIVEKDGSITEVKAKKRKKVLRREAERVIRLMPNWNPSFVNGDPVRTRCHLPIVFRLE